MGATSQNEIELQIRTRGAPEAVRAFQEVRAGAEELRAGADAGQALGGFDPAELQAATRQVAALVAELQDLRGVAVSAGGGVAQALGSVPAGPLDQVGDAAAGAGDALRTLATDAAGAGEQLGDLGRADAAPVRAVGSEADRAGRELRELGDAAEQGGRGVEQAGRRARRTADDMESLGDRVGRVADRMERVGNDLSTRVSLPLVAVGGASTKMAVDFDGSMTKIETLVGVNRQTVAGWREDLMELSPVLGALPGELAEGLFVVTSAGERGAGAMDVLTDASKASAIGMGETATIARTTTAAMQAYAAQNLTSARATDILVATAREGNFEVEQLAGSLGQVLPVAASMGVSFEEVGAFVASFTRVNGDAATSVTALRSYLQTLLNPTKEVETVLGKVGLSTAKLREEIREKGLSHSLLDLIGKFDGNTAALARVIPNVEGLVGVLGTAGLQGEQFAQVAQNVANSAGILDTAFARVSETDGFKIKQSLAELAVVGVKLGAELAPALVTVLEAAHPVVMKVGDLVEWFGELPEPVQAVTIGFWGLVAIAGPVTAGLGGVVSMVVELRAAVMLLNAANALGGTAGLATRAAGAVGTMGTAASGAAGAVGTAGLAGAASTLGTAVAVGGPLLLGLGAMAAILAEVRDNAQEAAEEVVGAVNKVKTAIPEMNAATVVAGSRAELQRARELYAELEEKRRQVMVLFNQGAAEPGAFGHATYMARRSEYDALATQYRAVLDLAKAFEAERDRRNTLPGLTVSVPGPKTTPIILEEDPNGRKRKETPAQRIGAGDGFARVVIDRNMVAELLQLQAQSSGRLRQLTTELALAEEALRRVPRGAAGWGEMNERVFRLRGDVRDLGRELQLLGGNLQGAKLRDLDPFLTVAGLDAAKGLGIDRAGLSKDRQQQLDQQHGLRQYAGLVAHRVDPRELRGAEREAVEAILQASGNTWDTLARDVGRGSREMEQAGVVAVNAFGSMVQAAISGTAQMETVVIQGFANMAQAALAQSNPLLGAGIGILGGIIGSLFSRRERREVQPVRVEEYSAKAISQQQRREGPDVVKVQVISGVTGEVTQEFEYELGRRSRRDAVNRIPTGRFRQVGGAG